NKVKPKSDAYKRYFSLFKEIHIPVPPIEVQREIVTEIEGYQKVIDGARAVVENYRPQIAIDPEWPIVAIGDIVDFVSGLTVSIPELESEGGIPILAINNVSENGNLTLHGLRYIKPPSKKLTFAQKGDLLFNWRNGSKHLVGKTALFDLDGDFLFASFLLGIRAHTDKVDNRYLWHTLNIYRREGRYMQLMRQNVNGLFNREELKVTHIPLPPLEIQNAIVTEIETEQRLVNANRELISRFQQKIQTTLDRIWGQPPTPQQHQPINGCISP
ncbi:restriction endonuclease subunit S, partial [Prochlorothrix hollandica]|uniref:restriction endonuclease subunit S n=1 Tax=Prochlorothrix hollandica TaxID=1223 RepID=UPI0033402F93